MSSDPDPDDDLVVVELETLWNRNFHALRDCREMQARARAIGIEIPIEHLLVQKRHLTPALAWDDGVTPPPAPTDVPHDVAEDKAITAAIARQRLTPPHVVGAQKVLDSLKAIGIKATLSYVLVALGHIRWEDLEEIGRSLAGGPVVSDTAFPVLDAQTDEAPPPAPEPVAAKWTGSDDTALPTLDTAPPPSPARTDPGSGVRKRDEHGSGVRKREEHGSGVRKRDEHGSGVRKRTPPTEGAGDAPA